MGMQIYKRDRLSARYRKASRFELSADGYISGESVKVFLTEYAAYVIFGIMRDEKTFPVFPPF
jgi:hypothetical protein